MTYKITLKTGDIQGAGTDGTVSVRFMRNGSYLTEAFTLDHSWYNDFEKGDHDTYELNTDVTLKDTDSLEISLAPGGVAPDWYLTFIDLHDETTGKRWHIMANQWFQINSQIRVSGTNSQSDQGNIGSSNSTTHVFPLGGPVHLDALEGLNALGKLLDNH